MKTLSKILAVAIIVLISAVDLSFAVNAPGPCESKDPYQSVQYTNILKSRLLRRITNDPSRKNDPVFGEATDDPCQNAAANQAWPYDVNVLKSRNADLTTKYYPQGITLTTSVDSEIKALFVNIANRIKLKLIS